MAGAGLKQKVNDLSSPGTLPPSQILSLGLPWAQVAPGSN